MNIFYKDALKRMKNSRTRTMVTIVGVALSTALITAVTTFAVSLQDYMVRGAIEKYGDWQVNFPDVDATFIEEQREDSRVSKVNICENLGYGVLDGGRNPYKPYVFVMGLPEDSFEELPITLVSGRLPENPWEILVPAHVALNGGVRYSLGDTITLNLGDRMDGEERLSQQHPYRAGEEPEEERETFVPREERAYTVVGICQRPVFEERTAPGYTLFTAADPVASRERFTAFITLKKPYQVHAYAKLVAGNGTYVLNDAVLRFMGLSEDQVFQMLLYSVGGILILLIMTGSVFLIYNAFNISLNERMHQFGILLSVGATAKQLRKSVIFEGLCIGLVGIPLGILVGLPSLQVVLALASGHFQNMMYDTVPLVLRVSLLALLVAAGVSLVTILISAYLPARKAAATPVMECIRQTQGVKLEPKTIKISKKAMGIYGLEGTLALKNFKRNRRRYRSIIMSLTLSVVLFISANTFQAELRLFARQSTPEMDGDILFTTRDMKEGELFGIYEELRQVAGVTGSTYQVLSTYFCSVPAAKLDTAFGESGKTSQGFGENGEDVELLLDIQFMEDQIFEEFLESQGLSLEKYTGPEASVIAVGKRSGALDIFTDSSLEVTIRSRENEETKDIRVDFVDVYPLDPPPVDLSEVKGYVFMGIVPYSLKSQFASLGDGGRECLTFWSENPGQSERQMKTSLEGIGVTCEYELYNIHKILEESRNMEFIIRLFTLVFVGMISLIAVANVFNTISTNIKLRRRELAMLRSVGMGDRAFNRMMRFECLFYGGRTLLLGLPLAVLLSFFIHQWLVWGGAEVAFIFPWASIGISVLGVFLVICITMLYAVSKIKKENIIDALRDDMT